MADEKKYRKWQLTINNPSDNGFTHETIKLTLEKFKSIIYWCMCDEVGEQGTYHTHVYFALKNGSRFETVKKRFPPAHIEIVSKGTSQENRDYIRKEGKYENSEKKETNLPETFEEWGEMPVEQQGARNDLSALYEMIKDGYSNFEILEVNPQYMLNIDKIERARQIIRENMFKSTWRDLEVVYIFGTTGSGKTRGVMEEYGYENVYRITDYEHPFDGYQGQDVVIFEEFRSSLAIQDMLNYLDGYPLTLPCRYANKVACFTKVYIITNVPLNEQYKNMQEYQKETWNAFTRRIHRIKQYTTSGVVVFEQKEKNVFSLVVDNNVAIN